MLIAYWSTVLENAEYTFPMEVCILLPRMNRSDNSSLSYNRLVIQQPCLRERPVSRSYTCEG